MSVEFSKLRSWLVMSMRYGRVELPDDYALLRNYRSIQAAHGPPSRSYWYICLRVDFTVFPAFPQLFAKFRLPRRLLYPPPLLLRYFSNLETFLEGLDTAEQACVENLYRCALKAELALTIRISLAADFDRTQRCWWVGTLVVSLLESAAATVLNIFSVLPPGKMSNCRSSMRL